MKKTRPRAASARKASLKIKKLALRPQHIAHVIVPKGMRPDVVPGKVPHEVAIVPVKAEPKEQSWLDYIFGPPEKINSKP
jgi:hypothetical protein